MLSKRGEILSSKTTNIILILIGFALILVLAGQLVLNTGEIDKEACHASVLAKAFIPDLGGITPVDLSLRCKTERICITTNSFLKGECSGDLGKEYENARISNNLTKEINEVLANSLLECWAMMGEGEISVFPRELFGSGPKCVICSRIAFDQENLKEEEIPERVDGLAKHLIRNKVPIRDVSYYEFLTKNDQSFYDNNIKERDFVKTNELAVVFYETRPSFLVNLGIISTSAIGGAAVGAKGGAIIGTVVPLAGTASGGIVGGVSGFVIGGLFGVASIEYFSNGDEATLSGIILQEHNLENLQEIGCTSFENIP